MRAAVVFVPLLVALAGCSNDSELSELRDQTSELQKKLGAQAKGIETLERDVAAARKEAADLKREVAILAEQANANQESLLGHAQVQTELTKSIELHATSLQRKTEADKGLTDIAKAHGERLDAVEAKATGNRSLLAEITATLQELLK